ncbi:MAG: ZIP family metal transporter [Alphaproteobacteria bacterium]
MFDLLLSGAVLFALAAAAVTTLGLVAVRLGAGWARERAGWFAAFAAGALISIAILHLIPEAFLATEHTPAWLLGGFAGAYFLNSGVLAFSNGSRRPVMAAGVLPLAAIAFHSFVDGIAYAVTFSVDFATGVLTVIGLIFHEIPEGIIVFTLLQRAGFPDSRAFLLAFLGAALTTPLGALTGTLLLSDLDPATLGTLFAITAGVLLYIGTSHLLPHVDSEPLRRKVPALLLGGAIGVAASSIHARGDPHEPAHVPDPAPASEAPG